MSTSTKSFSAEEFGKGSTEKGAVQHTERVDGGEGGLRIDGDDQDHVSEPKMTFRRFMSLTAMAFLWTGSQIPVYLFGAVPPYIYRDIGGADRWIWFILANLLALAGVCPFVGSLSDLLGRRYVALVGAAFLVLGMIVASTAQSMNIFICGMTLAGVGAGINELTALAATSEMAPTKRRGTYVAILIFTIVPFCPSVLWGQLIAAHSNWRYIGLFCGAWAALGFLFVAFFYFPPPRVNSAGQSRNEIIQRIDFVGGFLSIGGMVLFVMGITWGGYNYPWKSTHVLVPLIIGSVMCIAFCIWESRFAAFPMFPSRLRHEPRVLVLTLVITFISGANFFSILMFWPTQSFNQFDQDPVNVGVRGLPVGFGIMVGACVCLWALSKFRGHIRALMVISSCLMTAGCGALAVARVDNLYQLWGILIVASLGIGGIVVPASIITTIICPDDLIATVSALTLAIRVLGGTIGYSIYYNVFIQKYTTNGVYYIGGLMATKLNVTNPVVIGEAITLIGHSMLEELHEIHPVFHSQKAYGAVVLAGRLAFAESYKYVYYVSIAFGVVSIVCSCFLGDIAKYMDDHVAVVIH